MAELFPQVQLGQRKLEIADPDNLGHAIGIVLHRWQLSGKEPGAEHWTADRRYSTPELVREIREEWLSIMGKNLIFPWHDDYIVYAFVAARKEVNSEKRAFCEQHGLPIPETWVKDK